MFGAPIVFGWPAFFFLKAHHLTGKLSSVRWYDWVMCVAYLCVFMPTCMVAGTVSSVQSMIQNFAKHGEPFSCQLK